MDAHLVLIIGGKDKLLRLHGDVPAIDTALIAELTNIGNVAKVEPGYGGTWAGIFAENIAPIAVSRLITDIECCLKLIIKQVNPAKR